MKALNQGWQIHVLDEGSADDVIFRIPLPDEKWSRLNLAHRSDLIRTRLLIDYGGVWIDPTVYLTQPLDVWIHSKMKAGVFVFSNPGRDRLISNWFIAAQSSNEILKALFEELCAYWQDNDFRNHSRPPSRFEIMINRLINRNLWLPSLWLSWPFRKVIRLYPYMIYHYMFRYILRQDSHLEAIFSEVPRVPANAAIALQRHGLMSPFTSETQRILSNELAPLHKLSWKSPQGVGESDSVLNHLIRWTETLSREVLERPVNLK